MSIPHLLPEDLVEVFDAAFSITAGFGPSYWLDLDRTATYPTEFVDAFRVGGWLGMMIPEGYGGGGQGLRHAGAMMYGMNADGAGTSGAGAVHFYLFPAQPVVRFGSPEMRRRVLPELARGEHLVAFGVTEPDAGTDTSRIVTRAERDGDGWRITGKKVWTTNAQNATKILLLTRTSPRNPERPFEGMTLFFTDF